MSCNQGECNFDNVYEENSHVYDKLTNELADGRVFQFYTEEKLLLGLVKNGKKNGFWIYRYDNGMKRLEITFKENKPVGKVIF